MPSENSLAPSNPTSREHITVAAIGKPDIALQVQRPESGISHTDVVYVHGGTFGADLSIYCPFDGRSWADTLVAAGFAVWGFDFVGYGKSARYCADMGRPAGDIDDAMHDLRRVIESIRERNGKRPAVLLAHSRGAAVAARYAGEYPSDVSALVLFAPIVKRSEPVAASAARAELPSHLPLSAWAQYRRFIEDVPRGQPQVLSEAHMQTWGDAFLASDPTSNQRTPPSVMTPCGPLADIGALWSGEALYDPAKVTAPTLIVRGEWDSVCTDADAESLLDALCSRTKEDVKVPRASHLMHLEQQRSALYLEVERFIRKVLS